MQKSDSVVLLEKLISFNTVSRNSNLELIFYVKKLLEDAGIDAQLVEDETGQKANLFATIGPKDVPGIVLSGHTDVVPTDGQNWATDPFVSHIMDGNMYGRGTADMKGFIACAIIAFIQASKKQLSKPLHLCLSYDEEIGCIGVRRLLNILENTLVSPYLCIIGEPTLMQVATGHKGKSAYHAICHGEAGHSALAPQFTNAIHVASSMVQSLVKVQDRLTQSGAQDHEYDVPYTTVHVGKIQGGTALNIVPKECHLDFEIRNVTGDSPDDLIAEIEDIVQHDTQWRSSTDFAIEKKNAYPGLNTSPTIEAVKFLDAALPANTPKNKIAFGTEGGLFTHQLNCPVVVCGPGSISVAHQPNEYVALSQLDQCDAFLQKIVSQLV